jgi:hypothetical protein
MVPDSFSSRATYPRAFSPPSAEDLTDYASNEEYSDRAQSNRSHNDPG